VPTELNWTEINIIINYIWKKEKLRQERKDSIIVPIHKKSDKTNCIIYWALSRLQNFNNIYVKVNAMLVAEISGDHQYGLS
jgi:hypothetical protein